MRLTLDAYNFFNTLTINTFTATSPPSFPPKLIVLLSPTNPATDASTREALYETAKTANGISGCDSYTLDTYPPCVTDSTCVCNPYHQDSHCCFEFLMTQATLDLLLLLGFFHLELTTTITPPTNTSVGHDTLFEAAFEVTDAFVGYYWIGTGLRIMYGDNLYLIAFEAIPPVQLQVNDTFPIAIRFGIR